MGSAYYTYVLKSLKDGRRYIGYTEDLRERLKKHNSGSVRSTRYRIPFEIEYYEIYSTKKEAVARERFFKSKVGAFRLNEIMMRGRAAR
jgi:putative endonuclease